MKKAGRRFHRIFRAVFAAALALAITGANLAPAAAVTWADVNELKDEANGLDAEKKELQAKLDALADDKSQAVAAERAAGPADRQYRGTDRQCAGPDRPSMPPSSPRRRRSWQRLRKKRRPSTSCSAAGSEPWRSRDEVSYWSVLFRAEQLYRPAGPAGRHQRDHEVRPGRHRRPQGPSGGDRGEEGHAGEQQG